MSNFGDLVKWLRKEKGMTLDEVARKIKSHKGYVSGIENGKVNPPSVKIVRRFSKLFGCDERALVRLAWADKAPRLIREDAQRVLALMNAGSSSRTDLVVVPLLNTEVTGYPTELDAEGRPKSPIDMMLVLPKLRVPAELAATLRDDAMLQAEGGSFSTGDVVLLARSEKMENGMVAYVVFTVNQQRQAMVRQVKLEGDRVTLEPWNRNYSPVALTQDDVDACFRVVGGIKACSPSSIDAAV